MEDLSEQPEEYRKCLVYSFNYLKRCNIRVLGSDSFFKKYWRFAYIVPLLILHLLTLSMIIVNMLYEGRRVFEKPDIIPFWLSSVQACLKAVILMTNRKKLKILINNIGMEWRIGGLTEKQMQKKTIFLKHLNTGQKVYTNMAMFATWQILLMPFFETLFRRYFLHQESVFLIPFQFVYPFRITEWWTYIGVYVIQVYSLFIIAVMYLGADLLLIALCTCLSIQFVLLREDLMESETVTKNNRYSARLSDEITDTGRNKRTLEEFVKSHQKIILLARQLNGVFSKMIFVNLMFSNIIICFFALAAKTSSGAAYMVTNYGAIITVMMTILLQCSCGEMLSVASHSIAGTAAKVLWYEGDRHHQMSICFIIMRSQTPCTLTSLDSSAISLKTFTKVLSTTWSYFSLMKTLLEDRN